MTNAVSPVSPAAAPPSATLPNTERGDRLRRLANRSLLVSALASPPTVALYTQLQPIWDSILPLENPAFFFASALLGGGLAIGPLTIVIGFLLWIWWGVESLQHPRSHSTPLLDRVILGAGLLVWFAPTLSLLYLTAQALLSGQVHLVRPARDYFLATDPIPYWQSIGFWLIMAGLFAFLASRYWRTRLRAHPTAQQLTN